VVIHAQFIAGDDPIGVRFQAMTKSVGHPNCRIKGMAN